MKLLRRAESRGHVEDGWLNSWHTFSFGRYYDPNWSQYRSLRVLNDDSVQPGSGFEVHPHREMEILTYVVSGQLRHVDNTGKETVLEAGGVQRMTAGTGIEHSEHNASETDPLRFLQIWVSPQEAGLKPAHEDARIPEGANVGELFSIASPKGMDGLLDIHQDVFVYSCKLQKGDLIRYETNAKRFRWFQVVSGTLFVESDLLKQGDGLGIDGGSELFIRTEGEAEFLLFDLA